MAYDPSRREVEQLKKDLGHMPSLQDMLSSGLLPTTFFTEAWSAFHGL